MEQLLNLIIGPATSWLAEHPRAMATIVVLLALKAAVSVFVDSLVSSRAQWDKTPLTDDTWYEKALTWSVRILAVLGKATAALAGFRPKPKAEIIVEPKKP